MELESWRGRAGIERARRIMTNPLRSLRPRERERETRVSWRLYKREELRSESFDGSKSEGRDEGEGELISVCRGEGAVAPA